MEKVSIAKKDIPVIKETDVLVAGGGYAGVGAAICAARNGAKTVLIEQQSALGGLVTLGYVALTFSYIEGAGYDLFAELRKENAVKGRFVDPEITKVVLEKMLLKEGVTILYNTTAIDSIVEDSIIKGIVIFNKGGWQAIKAKRVIDTSGDGDVAAFAGAPFECGSPMHDGYNQATSLVCRIGNVDMEKYRNAGKEKSWYWTQEINRAVASGEFPYLIDKYINWVVVIPGRDPRHQEVCICYAHSRKCRNLDAEDLTRQLIEQREQNKWFIDFCRKHIPGYENAWLIDTAPMLGVRDSRRIMCEYKVTAEDIVENRRFPDAIMRGMHALDVHHPTEPGHLKHIVRKDKPGNADKLFANPGSWREIPYRALVPLKIDNLLIAGRLFSSDFIAQSGNRLVMECFNMGQAAGTAAAVSINQGVTPRKLDPQLLRKRLMEMNINLTEKPQVGVGGVSTEKEVKKEDLMVNIDGTTLIKREKLKEYKTGCELADDQSFEKLKDKKKDKLEKGYTNTGGVVGTNIE